MTDTVALEVRNVYKIFGKKQREVLKRLQTGASRDELTALGTAAVIDASFEVKKGEIFVVMGLSGSGKSTLIRMLNGLLEPTAGDVSVYGSAVSGVPAKQLRDVRLGAHSASAYRQLQTARGPSTALRRVP